MIKIKNKIYFAVLGVASFKPWKKRKINIFKLAFICLFLTVSMVNLNNYTYKPLLFCYLTRTSVVELDISISCAVILEEIRKKRKF